MACAPTSVSQQPRLPQWHGLPARVEAQVPDLAGVAARALQPVAAGDDAGTDTDVAGDVDEVVDADAAPRWCSASAPRSASLASETGTSRPSAARTMPPKETSCQLEVGGEPDQPVAAPHQARDADPDADQGARLRRALHDLADQPGDGARRPARPRLAGERAPRARWSTWPPRPTRATTARSTPRSTAMTKGPSSASRTPGRRPAGTAAPRRPACRCSDEPERLELGDQAARWCCG